MDIRDGQILLYSTNYYKGGADGILGTQTIYGVGVIERTQKQQYPSAKSVALWSKKRRLMAASQAILNARGYEAGSVDGLAGHNTKEAFRGWRVFKATGRREEVTRIEKEYYKPKIIQKDELPRQRDLHVYYGLPGAEVRSRLVNLKPPYTLRLDYNLRQRPKTMRIHELAAPSLYKALEATLNFYGIEEIMRLGLNRYAGGYNHRKMRGGVKWSTHSYGCAVDFYAEPNGLRMRCPQAKFCDSRYTPFLDIMENNGWLPALRLWGADAMHFQRAKL